MRIQAFRAGVWSLLLLGVTVPALAQPSNWQVLKFPGPSGLVDRTWCFGISPRGDMAGYYVAPPDTGFGVSKGNFLSISVPGALWTHAWGVNARGDIVGDFLDTEGKIRGFLFSKGSFTILNYPGVKMVHPRDISANGEIVGGHMATSSSPWVGLMFDKHGTATEFTYPGAVSTLPYGINAEGGIVGEFRDSGGKYHGFHRTTSGIFTQLDYPGATYTAAWKINSRGEIIGFYWDAGSPSISHGFLYKDGVYTTVDYPGATHTMIHGLNSEGEMCGMVSFSPPGSPIVWGGFSRTW